LNRISNLRVRSDRLGPFLEVAQVLVRADNLRHPSSTQDELELVAGDFSTPSQFVPSVKTRACRD